MRCTVKKILRCLVCLILLLSLCGCGQLDFDYKYSYESVFHTFDIIFNDKPEVADGFSNSIISVKEDLIPSEVNISDATAALLFDITNKKVLCAKNVHEKLHPASTTKILTAIVAMKNGRFDQMLTATNAVNISDPGAKLLGLKPGDKMTLEQAMNIMLIYSGNDVANLVAENIGGSVSGFVDMMNEEAKKLGATSTHFTNPHGLTEDNHLTSAYDLYLLLNEAVKYKEITDIIQKSSYETTYKRGNKDVNVSVSTTNQFLRGEAIAPPNTYVIGGKTGTTNEAGHCLMILVKDAYANQYIAVMLGCPSTADLYNEMTDMLKLINEQ